MNRLSGLSTAVVDAPRECCMHGTTVVAEGGERRMALTNFAKNGGPSDHARTTAYCRASTVLLPKLEAVTVVFPHLDLRGIACVRFLDGNAHIATTG